MARTARGVTRRQERTRRVAAWLALIGAGLVAAVALARADAGLVATVPLAFALAIGHRVMIAPPGAAILTYHSISPDARWLPWSLETSVDPHTFDIHLQTLRRMGDEVVATNDLIARRRVGKPPSGREVVLHFDDGYRDNWLFAVPALVRHAMPATFFVSLDFIEPGDQIRGAEDHRGYMNWPEIAAVAANPLFEMEPHGVDHARVPVSSDRVGTVDARNWRRHAWLQWAAMPGPKYDWFRHTTPPAVAIGSPIPASALALAAPAWTGAGREPVSSLERRIEHDLSACRAAFEERLGQTPTIFCWPENRVGAEGRRIAADLGYRATTGGSGRNTAGEPPQVLSRIHMGDRALGFRLAWAEALHLRAAVRCAQGNLYWYLILGPMNWTRTAVMGRRRALRESVENHSYAH